MQRPRRTASEERSSIRSIRGSRSIESDSGGVELPVFLSDPHPTPDAPPTRDFSAESDYDLSPATPALPLRSASRRHSPNSGGKDVFRRGAEKLSLRWRLLGGCGVCCLFLSTASLLILGHANILMNENRGGGNKRDGDVPAWFANRPVPRILLSYVDKHNRAVSSPFARDSRFLIHELPKNETQLSDTFLGLVSSFLLAVVTDRALLVEWTNDWKTPLDAASKLGPTPGQGGGAGAGALYPATSVSLASSPASSTRWNLATLSSLSAVGGAAAGAPLGGMGGPAGGGAASVGTRRALQGAPVLDDDERSAGGQAFNETSTRRARRVRLRDVLDEPGFEWDLEPIRAKFEQKLGKGLPPAKVFDPLGSIEKLACRDLGADVLGLENKFVKVTPGYPGRAYFAALLLVNPHYSELLEGSFEGGLGWAFADLFNFLVRPVSEVMEAVDRFKVRYMDGNTVVGLEMSVNPGHGDWAGTGLMPADQQNLFFEAASKLVASNSPQQSGAGQAEDKAMAEVPSLLEGSARGQGVVFLLATDNQAEIQARFHQLEAADLVNGAGVVAILAATGDGVARVRLELQELWMLGLSDVAITTPGSRLGILGAARTHKAPLVVVSEESVHASAAPYPCYAQFGAVQYTSCFVPSMLSKIPADSLVPC